jgi:uncharacterized protein YuzB (UPF0349 family)
MTGHRSARRRSSRVPVTRSLVSPKTVAGAQEDPGGDEDDPAEHRIDEGDDVRAGGDIREQEDGDRDRTEQSCEHKRDGECRAALTHALEQSLSKRSFLHPLDREWSPGTQKGPVLPDGGSPVGANSDEGSETPDNAGDKPPETPVAVVEYCVNNLPSADRERLGAADIEARAMPCLERCGTCRTTPFLVVDGELHTAVSDKRLRETLPEVGP